jgi:phosphatidate cytidylyltransferase
VIASQDRELWILLAWVTGILVTVSSVTFVLHRVLPEGPVREIADNLALRTKSFWLVFLLFAGALVSGEVLSILLFMGLSLLALREFLTIAPIEPSDHRAMIWTFFVITPLQYFLIGIHWYGFYSVMIPVWAFLFIPTLNAMVGDSHRFLERTATLQWGLMVCVYCVSFAPALLRLRIPGYEGENPKLLLYCVGVVQLSDFLQFLFGKWLGRHPMAPRISPKKSWEGCLLGVAAATFVGTILWYMTPFRAWQAAVLSLVISLMGVAGGLTMSAIKRDRGVKDFGALLPGHGGMLDRIDSVVFSVPVFFHLTRFFFARGS